MFLESPPPYTAETPAFRNRRISRKYSARPASWRVGPCKEAAGSFEERTGMRMHSELRLEQPRRSELGEALLVVSQLSMTRVGIRAANEIGPRRMITVRVAAIWCEQ